MAYNLVAVDFLDGQAVNAALTRLSSRLASGALQPLPLVVHGLGAAQAALRQMSQARHVGKIVVRSPLPQAASVVATGTVIVTGGLGTLGSLTASWLAHTSGLGILVTGRVGRLAGSNSLAALVHASGRLITMISADASSPEDAAHLIGSSAVEVVGLMHASGVLADATLQNQTARGLRTVFAPKMAALHTLQQGLSQQPGAFQVLFSSIASLLGSPGQGNYSAANSTLDTFSQASQTQVGLLLQS